MKTNAEREEFLKQPHVAVLATIGPGNRPHAVPIWYLYEDGRFVMSTRRGSQKHLNVDRNCQAVLVIDDREPPYYAVMIQGTVEVGPSFTPETQLRMSTRYLGEKAGRAYRQQSSSGESLTIIFNPERFVEYYGVGLRRESHS